MSKRLMHAAEGVGREQWLPHKSYTLFRWARRAFLFFTASNVNSSGRTPALCILSMTSHPLSESFVRAQISSRALKVAAYDSKKSLSTG